MIRHEQRARQRLQHTSRGNAHTNTAKAERSEREKNCLLSSTPHTWPPPPPSSLAASLLLSLPRESMSPVKGSFLRLLRLTDARMQKEERSRATRGTHTQESVLLFHGGSRGVELTRRRDVGDGGRREGTARTAAVVVLRQNGSERLRTGEGRRQQQETRSHDFDTRSHCCCCCYCCCQHTTEGMAIKLLGTILCSFFSSTDTQHMHMHACAAASAQTEEEKNIHARTRAETRAVIAATETRQETGSMDTGRDGRGDAIPSVKLINFRPLFSLSSLGLSPCRSVQLTD